MRLSPQNLHAISSPLHAPSQTNNVLAYLWQSLLMATLLFTSASAASAQSIDYSAGFSPGDLTFSGVAIEPGALLQLTSGRTFTAGSVFRNTPVDVHAFTTDFLFELTGAQADGFAFVLQTGGPEQIGATGGNLGFLGMPAPGLAIAFALAGPNENTINLYASSGNYTYPQIGQPSSLRSNGIDLHNGDLTRAHITFDGKDLVITLTDTVTKGNATASYAVSLQPGQLNAPIFGGEPAYVGFTGATGANTATQDILSWTFTSGMPVTIAAPVFSPVSGSCLDSPTVKMTSATPGATIYYTTNDAPPGTNSTVYAPDGAQVIIGDAVKAVAVLNGVASPVTTGFYVNPYQSSQTFDFRNLLFTNHGSATDVCNGLQLTGGDTPNQAGSSWMGGEAPSNRFFTTFDFLITHPAADGFMFVVRGLNTSALGYSGGDLGFAGIGSNSYGIKFDLFNNAGEGVNSTGLYMGGQNPTTPSIDLTPSGIDLHSGHIFHVQIVDDGQHMNVSITDKVTGAQAVQDYPSPHLNVDSAYSALIGFTGGAGALSATQVLMNFQYSLNPGTTAYPPAISPAPGTYRGPVNVSFDGSGPYGNENVYYTLDGSTPTVHSASSPPGTVIPVTGTTTIRYIGAVRQDYSRQINVILSETSAVHSATYTITPH